MDLAKLIPPSDLLQKVQGVESALRRRRRLGMLAWLGVALSIGEVLLELNKTGLFTSLSTPLLIPLVLGIAFLALASWSTFWLEESEQPFRYTCSIARFEMVGAEGSAAQVDERMRWLAHDLQQLLNERVQRFLFLDESKVEKSEEGDAPLESHIHVRGHYVLRPQAGDEKNPVIEMQVMPAVRIGDPTRPENLAHPPPPRIIHVGTGDVTLERSEYDDVLEQVYHSVVTEIYRQLKDDVRRKIKLLPSRRFRAIALLHEADDYARSNTLHAYEEARDLYREAAALIDPRWALQPSQRPLRFLRRMRIKFFDFRKSLRHRIAEYRPGLAEIDVLCARAEIGYAKMLLFRRALAALMGERLNPVYEARPRVQRALQRLAESNPDVPGRAPVIFDGHVALALACLSLSDRTKAGELLRQAAAMTPDRAETDPVYLYAFSDVAEDVRSALGSLRRALELAPRFEVVQFQLAIESEGLWRSRSHFERDVAELVRQEYQKLLRINPGNIGAWANLGYIHWLLGNADDLQKAYEAFESGRKFKEIKRTTFISELDYGLARVHAERGDVSKAFQSYAAAISAKFSQGSAHNIEYSGYYFEPMSRAVLRRFARYRRNVRRQLFGATPVNAPDQHRLRDAVYGFVLNDVGDAYYTYYHAFGSNRALDCARRAYEAARQFNPEYALPPYNLARLDSEQAVDLLHEALALEPEWADARLELADWKARRGTELRSEAESDSATAEQLRQQNILLDEQCKRLRAEAESTASLRLAPHEQNRYAAELPVYVSARSGEAWSAAALNQVNTLQREMAANEQEAARLDRLANSKLADAPNCLEAARELARALLPHQWLWRTAEDGSNDLDWRRLSDSEWIVDLRWERELTEMHVKALYTWAQPLIQDTVNESSKQNAITLLQHIRRCFWPVGGGLLSDLANLGVETDAEQQIAAESRWYLTRTPASYTRLTGLGDFPETERIKLIKRSVVRYPENRRFRQLLADEYARIGGVKAAAKEWSEAAEAYRTALQWSSDAWIHTRLADVLTQQAGTSEDLLDQAVAEAEQAARLDPGERYREALRMQRAKRKILDHNQKVVRRCGASAWQLEPRRTPLAVEYSPSLRNIFAPAAGSAEADDQQASLTNLRDGMYYELGMYFPEPVLRENAKLPANSYMIMLEDVPIAGHELRPDRWYFPGEAAALEQAGIPLLPARNPANGAAGFWIEADYFDEAEAFARESGSYFWKPFGFVVLHVAGLLRGSAAEFLRRDDVGALVASAGITLRDPAELVPLTAVLRALISEQVPIRDLHLIVEIFEREIAAGKTPLEIAEAVRADKMFRAQIPWLGERFSYFRLGPGFQAAVNSGLVEGKGIVLALEPVPTQEMLATIRQGVQEIVDRYWPVIMTQPEQRPWVRKLIELEFPHFHVVSQAEVFPDAIHRVAGTIEMNQAVAYDA